VTAQRWVLMGDPTHFSVKGGANPHTRTRWGTRRTVDKVRAIAQWHGLRVQLEELGIRVLVVPPVAEWPGTVYPANAGLMLDVDVPMPAADKRFVLSNLLPTRAGEPAHYARVLAEAGIPTETIDPRCASRVRPTCFPRAATTCSRTGGSRSSASCPRSRCHPGSACTASAPTRACATCSRRASLLPTCCASSSCSRRTTTATPHSPRSVPRANSCSRIGCDRAGRLADAHDRVR
jgi:hypothetical protein